ncbi:4Fe-4S dicluster domain-containing protein [Seleniivibrio woodruffii]|uniref:Tetrathionate reductase subunit B n=1 Tax=Seleniivibrio woodruffii TaxID=1078050 RepID=A0A4R1KBR3_9BACT|nr:4Fe-4S dicluster domain-containing protein [Seleniivibrio woodruffii]TCK61966.1 tetrathionate reductase subunit B [Seleniivibrio woodruffii]TVZ34917.1 tetrathionate reductase subunit B [Seleniivibrio woodruffii]
MKKKYAMAYIVDRCVDCKACMVACKAEWEVPEDKFRTHIDTGVSPDYTDTMRMHFLPHQCNHCDDAPCVTVCPTKASYKREDGIVSVNQKICVGCKYCIVSCPYDARFFNHELGVAEKCTFCLPRIAEGLAPACVTTCPGNVRVFGDINDPNSEISALLRDAATNHYKVWKLRQDLGTRPNIYYIQK